MLIAMKIHFKTKPKCKIDEMATRWKEEGLEGPYPLESGEMGGTLDVLKQYVTPDDEKATHFIHFGGVKERDVTAVKKGMKGAVNTYTDKKLGPAKSVTAPNRQSKHGPSSSLASTHPLNIIPHMEYIPIPSIRAFLDNLQMGHYHMLKTSLIFYCLK